MGQICVHLFVTGLVAPFLDRGKVDQTIYGVLHFQNQMMMTRLHFVFPLLFISTSFFAQFNWQPTGGPAGPSSGALCSNEQFAFFSDDYHLYRTADGLAWETLPFVKMTIYGGSGGRTIGKKRAETIGGMFIPQKLMTSYDDGMSWIEADFPVGLYEYASLVTTNHGTYTLDGSNQLMFRTQDDGVTWDTVHPPIQDWIDLAVFDDRLFVAGEKEIYRSDDQGETWTDCTPNFSSYEYRYGFLAVGQALIVTTDKNIWHSTDDGVTWGFQPRVGREVVKSLAKIGGRIYGAGLSSDFFKTEDFGATWTPISLPNNSENGYDLLSFNNHLLARSFPTQFFRWDEPTQSFLSSNQGLKSGDTKWLLQSGQDLYSVTQESQLFRFNLATQSWDDTDLFAGQTKWVNQVAVSGNGDVYALSLNPPRVIYSTDNGQIWKTLNLPPGQSPSEIGTYFFSLLRFTPIDTNLFLGFPDYYTFRTGNHGASWQTYPEMRSSVVKFRNGYFSSSNSAILFSADGGISWNEISTFSDKKILSLYATSDMLFAVMQNTVGEKVRMYVSRDGVNWEFAHNGLPFINFSYNEDMDMEGSFHSHDGKYYAYHPEIGYFGSVDTCKNWLPIEFKRYGTVAFKDSIFFIDTGNGGLLRSNPPQVFGKSVTGTVYSDNNNNGVRDLTEQGILAVNIVPLSGGLWPGDYTTRTNFTGEYVLNLFPGFEDEMKPIINSKYIESVNPPFYSVQNSGVGYDFGVKFVDNIHDLNLTANDSPRPVPGQQFHYYINCKNEGTVKKSPIVSLILDSDLTYVSASRTPAAVFGDSIVWNLPSVTHPYSESIIVTTKVPMQTPIGTPIEARVWATSDTTDFTPDDNWKVLRDTVVGPYDPNAKVVEPADGLTAQEIAESKPLTYTIHFQNTGTYPAERVRITDILDTALNWTTLRLDTASHPVSAFQVLTGGILQIIFYHIMLPDSFSNEAASHGFVRFTIERNKAFNAQKSVRNNAAIYFDGNDPIFTNTVYSGIKSSSSSMFEPIDNTKDIPLHISPNPCLDAFWVTFPMELAGPGLLSLHDAAGRRVFARSIQDLSKPIQVNTQDLSPGIYFVNLQHPNQSFSARVLVVPPNR